MQRSEAPRNNRRNDSAINRLVNEPTAITLPAFISLFSACRFVTSLYANSAVRSADRNLKRIARNHLFLAHCLFVLSSYHLPSHDVFSLCLEGSREKGREREREREREKKKGEGEIFRAYVDHVPWQLSTGTGRYVWQISKEEPLLE